MGVVTRYFDVSAAGSGDGTSYANRAALISSGAFSTIITGFDFSASDSLECIVEPGVYTGLTTTLNNAAFANAPALARKLLLQSSGYVPSNWLSCQPIFPRDNLVRIQSSSNIEISVANSIWRGFSFEFSGRNAAIIGNVTCWLYGCIVENTNNGTSSSSIGSNSIWIKDSWLACTGTAFNAIAASNGGNFFNTRFSGNPSASSGNRRGLTTSFATGVIDRVTISGVVTGVISTSASNPSCNVLQSTFITSGVGVDLSAATTVNTSVARVDSSFIVSGGDGVDVLQGFNINNNRIRAGGTALPNQSELSTLLNYTAAGSDNAEFVNPAADDYRIKYGSIYWGFGIGAGDEPEPAALPTLRGGFSN